MQTGKMIILKEGATLEPNDVTDFCRGKILKYKLTEMSQNIRPDRI